MIKCDQGVCDLEGPVVVIQSEYITLTRELFNQTLKRVTNGDKDCARNIVGTLAMIAIKPDNEDLYNRLIELMIE